MSECRPTGGRVGLPTSGVPGTLYDFVRRYLVEHSGIRTRDEVLAALQAHPDMKERLARSRGFNSLIHNMRHSGDLLLEGDYIRITARALRRH